MVSDDELLEFGRKLAEEDPEARRWFNWYNAQIQRFEANRTSNDEYKIIQGRYLGYLAKKYEKIQTLASPKSPLERSPDAIPERHYMTRWKAMYDKMENVTEIQGVSDKLSDTKPPERKEPLINRIRLNVSEFYEAKAFSRVTQIGIIIFFVSLTIGVILGLTGRTSNEQTQRLIQVIIFPFYFMILSFVIDVLRWREFSEWGALGVLITDLGIIFFFLPGVFFAFPVFTQILHQIFFLPADFTDYILMIPIGVLLIILGVSLHRTDWDDKIVNLATMSILYLRNYQYKEAIRAIFKLIKTTIRGLVINLIRGLRYLPSRISRFIKITVNVAIKYIENTLLFLGHTFSVLGRGIWRNLHWVGLFAVLLYLQASSLPSGYLVSGLVLIMLFFTIIGILYTNQPRASTVIRKVRVNVIKRVASTYSMLSGSNLELNNSVFCTQCLRGIQTSEFESLILVKGTMDPECPFCGSKSWFIAE